MIEATKNPEALAATAATGGNLKVGKATAAITGLAEATADPINTDKNPVAAYEAAKNLREVGKMVKGWLSKNLDGLKRKFVGKPKPTEEKK